MVDYLKRWLSVKRLKQGDRLFQLETAKGHLRKTSQMMATDLSCARNLWINAANAEEERKSREASDFLTYQNSDGLFADFHSNRHTFITRLGRNGTPLMTAQKLARHSDPKLTSNIYDHLEQDQKVSAVESLQGLPAMDDTSKKDDSSVAGIVAGGNAVSSPSEACHDKEHQLKESAFAEPNSPGEGTLVHLCQFLTDPNLSSGGGTRTPDTRIMIPLL